MKAVLLGAIMVIFVHQSIAQTPLRLAIAGLSHGHVDWIFNRMDKYDVQLVGIYETNPELIERYAKCYAIDRSLFFTDLGDMLAKLKPDAVSAIGAISDHVELLRTSAPRKVHVMVEPPSAATLAVAQHIAHLA